MNHPIQPIEIDSHGHPRFKRNTIVDFLAKNRLNELAAMDFPQEDWEQLAQLIGYSLSGFSELSYVRNETFDAATSMHEHGTSEEDARIYALENMLADARDGLRKAACALFQIHPDDLHA